MERRGPPLHLLLEACSFILRTALDMAAGPETPASPTLPFKGGIQVEGNATGAAATEAGAAQEGWEAFNRSMDDRDEEVLKAATAAAEAGAGTGEGTDKERELPAFMLEVVKVAMSLLRRLSNRNLTAAGPFASAMQMWPAGHPQVRYIDGCLFFCLVVDSWPLFSWHDGDVLACFYMLLMGKPPSTPSPCLPAATSLSLSHPFLILRLT